MRTIRTKVFQFNELSEKAKLKAIELLRDINTDFDNTDYLTDEFINELQEVGFENAEIYYRGFWSQGDGLCFDADISASKLAITLNDKRLANLIDNGLIEGLTIEKTDYANRYSHEHTRFIDYTATDYSNINDALECFSDSVNVMRVDLCKDFYRRLQKEFEYLQSDISVIETIEANQYEFTSTGNLFN